MTHKTFPSVPESSWASSILDIIHGKIIGPIDPVLLVGSRYLLLFTDNFTRYKIGYMLKKTSDALKGFKKYKPLVKKLQRKHIHKP